MACAAGGGSEGARWRRGPAAESSPTKRTLVTELGARARGREGRRGITTAGGAPAAEWIHPDVGKATCIAFGHCSSVSLWLLYNCKMHNLTCSPICCWRNHHHAFRFLQHDISSAPVVKLSRNKCGGRLDVQRSIELGRSRDVRWSWRTLSTDQAQASVVDIDEECKQLLTSLSFSSEDAEKMLKKAFGWIHSPYWSEERKKEVPTAEALTGVLNYIRSLGLSDEDLHKLLKKFPEVLGCDLDAEVKLNVSKLDSDWGINGKTLRSLLLRNPKVLGYNIDCRGDCMAQCTRCWVRF